MKKIKFRHNKKRNTAFLYESLVRELTRTIISKKGAEKKKIVSVLKESFHKGSLLYKELQLYKALYETRETNAFIAEKLLQEAKKEHENLDSKKLFSEQTRMIKRINKILSKNVFLNFVPNYKNLATIAQVFSKEVPVKDRIILEDKIIEQMCAKIEKQEKMASIDNLVYKTFIEKFNSSYKNHLTEDQKKLLEHYILSFSDNGVSLKLFLNEEIGSLKKELKKSLLEREIKEDSEMFDKTKKVFEMIDQFQDQKIDQEMIKKVLKVQSLICEIQENVN